MTTIILESHGGIIYIKRGAKGIKVVMHDYDIDGMNDDATIHLDKDGQRYWKYDV